jgi:flagellar hook-basal body complex protein FliE
MDVTRIQTTEIPQGLSASLPPDRVKSTFGEFFQQSLAEVDRLHQEAEKAAQEFALGQANSIHETMLTLEKADIALRLVTQIRNKGVEAYQEIMRMQI